MLTCTKPEMVALLGGFVRSTSDARELKRALAVGMAVEGKPYEEIKDLNLVIGVGKMTYQKQRHRK